MRNYGPNLTRRAAMLADFQATTEKEREAQADREAAEKGRAYVAARIRARSRQPWEPMPQSWMIDVERETAADEARGIFRHHPRPTEVAPSMTAAQLSEARRHHGDRKAA